MMKRKKPTKRIVRPRDKSGKFVPMPSEQAPPPPPAWADQVRMLHSPKLDR